ncbi:hypothetical protein SAMN02745751_02014 [Dethiosulfatibacter aminovorans DSM 17477]|uniref:Radical SAM core domain-containing protein n=1 Tax=Dethiosulfatibacter aminovorans DSM 17477 TaxID=1121476 RepID=A0A1M6HGV3_9FIRM|nr:TIGR01212 family radical SAM protein [Dethiosulfatibacter aminovorans]SHJ21422.1 hypothetical protein SAMN02745751_02014 [Dethiosulfatibacter aminovorans DSM 17477]
MYGEMRYRTLNYELKKTFGEKVVKLSIDGGFTCPNRDGTIDSRGCIFCSEMGSGEFAGSRELSIIRQIEEQKALLGKKWKSGKYIAYFGSFTNTYAPVEELRRKYYEALGCEGVIGLAVATRADCISDEIMDLFREINEKYFLWVEIGLQSIHEDSAKYIRRGYDLNVFNKTFNNLHELGIKTVVHIILGIPGEDRADMMRTVDYVSRLKPWGVKLHMLHVIKNTDLEKAYLEEGFPLFEKEEYVKTICDSLERLHGDIVIHRITGDGKKSDLVGPRWSLDKLRVISEINMEMKRRDSFQGCRVK